MGWTRIFVEKGSEKQLVIGTLKKLNLYGFPYAFDTV